MTLAIGAHRPFVKICGLTSPAEALAAHAAGASALGLLVGLTHAAADGVAETTARSIITALGPAGADTVLVTHLTDPEEVATLARRIGCATIQIHGAMPPSDLRTLRAASPAATLIKAIHVTGPEALAQARAYAPTAATALADALLLDSRTADRLGGTGRTHDWSVSRSIVDAVAPVPVILAGGLTPDNVAAAIAAVRPAGVDVNSGVEHAGGGKDPGRMRAFVAAAHRALAA